MMLSTKEIGAIAETLLHPNNPESARSNHPALKNKELRQRLNKMIYLSGGNPIDPVSAEDYMERIKELTTGRPAELFLTSFFLNYQPQAPTIKEFRVCDGAVYVDFDGGSHFCRNRHNPELPSGLPSRLLLLRLLTSPETAEIDWFASDLSRYRGGIPARVGWIIYYMNKSFPALWEDPDASLSYQVIFAAADGAKIGPMGGGAIDESLLLTRKVATAPQIELEILPLVRSGKPVSFAVDTSVAAAVQDAERYLIAATHPNPESNPLAEFAKQPARAKLGKFGSTVTVAQPPFRRFLTATVTDKGESISQIVTSWDGESDSGDWS